MQFKFGYCIIYFISIRLCSVIWYFFKNLCVKLPITFPDVVVNIDNNCCSYLVSFCYYNIISLTSFLQSIYSIFGKVAFRDSFFKTFSSVSSSLLNASINVSIARCVSLGIHFNSEELFVD